MGENPEWENRVYGKRKERLAREGPGGNELVVVRGFYGRRPKFSRIENHFLGLFCVHRGFEVSRGGGQNEC